VSGELARILEVAERAARNGATSLERRYLDATIEPELKGEYDFVSVADRESEKAIIDTILTAFPDHGILAEESGRLLGGAAEFEWVVDPLDGTTNFLQGLPMFSVSIACRRGDATVVGVIFDALHGNLFTAARGEGAFRNGRPMRVSSLPDAAGSFLATGYPFRAREALDLYLDVFRDVFLRARALRRCGSAAIDLAFTAAGVFDGFFEFRLSPWDVAAGALLIEEAGGLVSDLDGGDRYLETGNVIAGGPGVFAELRDRIGALASESRLDELVPRATE
jgi:myo-inositol-1(or 4)-monophosphatase